MLTVKTKQNFFNTNKHIFKVIIAVHSSFMLTKPQQGTAEEDPGHLVAGAHLLRVFEDGEGRFGQTRRSRRIGKEQGGWRSARWA